jgi:hydrogenase large subunit
VVARLTEVARIVPQMEHWLAALQLDEAFQLATPPSRSTARPSA